MDGQMHRKNFQKNSIYECGFQERFRRPEGAVVVDLDERIVGRKIGIRQSVAIKPAGVWNLLDERIIEKMALI
jgi:hypothetical protein